MGLAILLAALVPARLVAAEPSTASPSALVRAMLDRPESEQDFERAAIAFDRFLDPGAKVAVTEAMIARLVDAARQMAGPNPSDAYKIAAVRKAIYEAGPWNRGRAFQYDRADPLGQTLRNKLLSTYVETRLGNCVSMPVLFLIVADRIGLNVRLAAAPLHVFVRYRDAAGAERNLEPTSGGRVTRTEWYRQNLPMTDRSIESGIYMRTLSRRESVALMANAVVEFMIDRRRYQDAVEVADAILAVNPRDAYTLVKKGTAVEGLIRTEFLEYYATPALIPPPLRMRYVRLVEANAKVFRDAEALGWEPATR